MKGSKVAKRYARALIELAADQKQLEAWGGELERLAGIVSAPEISDRLVSPELPVEMRIQVIAKIAERMELSFPLRSFAVVVARHARIGEMASISEAYQALADEALGRARATVIFARKPSEQDIEKITEALGAIVGKKIIPTVNVDESLVGGVVAELEGKIYDGSLATRLAEAQQRLSGQS